MMRLKWDRTQSSEFRCCLCCHVRTGTILIGVLHLMVYLLFLSVFALFTVHPEVLPFKQGIVGRVNQTELTPDLAAGDAAYTYEWLTNRRWTSEDKFVGLLLLLCLFMVSLMLVYGSLRGRPSYLMPFFCLQVFDFCISCLCVIGYFSYTPNVKTWIAHQEYLPYVAKQHLLKLNADWLMLFTVGMFVCSISVKAYFIGVVWACYKYLTQKMTGGVVRTYNAGPDPTPTTEDTEMLLPPKYEDVVSLPPEQPPVYTAGRD